jgi:hypothetical protein
MWSQRREEQWRRLHELASALYNKEGASGAWVQFLAAQELERLKTRKKEAKVETQDKENSPGALSIHHRAGLQRVGRSRVRASTRRGIRFRSPEPAAPPRATNLRRAARMPQQR